MLIKKKLRREIKKIGEDISERGGEVKEFRREEKRGKKKNVRVFYIKGREKKKKRRVCYEIRDSSFFYYGIFQMILLIDN